MIIRLRIQQVEEQQLSCAGNYTLIAVTRFYFICVYSYVSNGQQRA